MNLGNPDSVQVFSLGKDLLANARAIYWTMALRECLSPHLLKSIILQHSIRLLIMVKILKSLESVRCRYSFFFPNVSSKKNELQLQTQTQYIQKKKKYIYIYKLMPFTEAHPTTIFIFLPLRLCLGVRAHRRNFWRFLASRLRC